MPQKGKIRKSAQGKEFRKKDCQSLSLRISSNWSRPIGLKRHPRERTQHRHQLRGEGVGVRDCTDLVWLEQQSREAGG